MLVTGVALMLFSTRFVLFEFHDRWSVLLLLKQTAFLLMVIFSLGFARMFRRLEDVSNRGVEGAIGAAAYYQRMVQFGKINVALGIAFRLAQCTQSCPDIHAVLIAEKIGPISRNGTSALRQAPPPHGAP